MSGTQQSTRPAPARRPESDPARAAGSGAVRVRTAITRPIGAIASDRDHPASVAAIGLGIPGGAVRAPVAGALYAASVMRRRGNA